MHALLARQLAVSSMFLPLIKINDRYTRTLPFTANGNHNPQITKGKTFICVKCAFKTFCNGKSKYFMNRFAEIPSGKGFTLIFEHLTYFYML